MPSTKKWLKKASNMSYQHILNLRQQFYRHRLDNKTIERIKELGQKRKFRGSRGGRNKTRAWSSNKGVHQHLLQTLPKCGTTKWNDTPIRMLLINIHSMKGKIDTLLHHITLNDIDIYLIIEIWIQTDHYLQILDANISGLGYKIINKCRENKPGGGIACIYKGHFDIRMHTKDNTYISFESLTVKLMIKSKLHWISTIYRPPYSSKHPIPTSTFIDEFSDHVSHLLCQTDNPIIVGDMNIPWNKIDNLDTISLTEILELYNLKQHVASPTHKQGNTIDWVMNVRDTDDFTELHTSEFLLDYCTIKWQMNIKRPDMVKTRSMIRNLKRLNRQEFASDLDEELNKNTHDRQPLQELYDGFISSIETTLDKHAPLRECIKTVRNNQPWFDEDAKKLKLQRRLAEKHWLKSRTAADKTHYMHINKCYLRHLYQSKKSYINTQLESNNNNSQMLFRFLNQLTKGQHDNPLQDCSSYEDLANKFADFFIEKIEMIRSQFQQSRPYTPPSQKCKNMTQFRPMNEDEILKILNNMKKTTCDVNPCNKNFLMEFRKVLLGTWTKIINKLLLSGHFLQSWKKAIIRPLIKCSKLHREFKNYQPISNLSFISKSIEKAALLQFATFFEDQDLLPTYQSAYHKHHSTETAVLNICDEILENAEHNKLTAMVCIDLSAAFDTVNHSILKSVMEHYFGLKDTALRWLCSYISNRQFSVKIGSSLSHTHTINFSAHKGAS